MYPYERSLVRKFANKPFTLIGVNSDDDVEGLKEVLKTEKISWRSFRNESQGANKAISTQWNVSAWPTLFLIDHRGIIRYRCEGCPEEKELDEAIGRLVSLAEKEVNK